MVDQADKYRDVSQLTAEEVEAELDVLDIETTAAVKRVLAAVQKTKDEQQN